MLGSDVTLVRNAQNTTPGASGSLYTIFNDVNGSGTNVGSDMAAVRNRQGLSLPAGEPSAPTLRRIATAPVPETPSSALVAAAASTADAVTRKRLTDGLV